MDVTEENYGLAQGNYLSNVNSDISETIPCSAAMSKSPEAHEIPRETTIKARLAKLPPHVVPETPNVTPFTSCDWVGSVVELPRNDHVDDKVIPAARIASLLPPPSVRMLGEPLMPHFSAPTAPPQPCP